LFVTMAGKEFVLNGFGATHEDIMAQSESLPEYKSKGKIHTQMLTGTRVNVAKWLMYDEKLFPQVVSTFDQFELEDIAEGTAPVPKHFAKLATQVGAKAAGELRDDKRPNYAAYDNKLYALDTVAALDNLRQWFDMAFDANYQSAKQSQSNQLGLPNRSKKYLMFNDNRTLIKNIANCEVPDIRQMLDTACLLFVNKYNVDNDIHTGATIALAETIAVAKKSIPKFAIVSKYGDVWKMQSDERARRGLPTPIMEDSDRKFNHEVDRKQTLVERLFDIAKATFIKHHGRDGNMTPEALANARHANRCMGKGSGTEKAPKWHGQVDPALLRYQAVWWHFDVSGWLACTLWAISLAVDRDEYGLSDHELEIIIQYVFARSSYRKILASDAVYDSTRDLAASEVTQAASIAVRADHGVPAVILAMDDIEYAITRNHSTPELDRIYRKVLSRAMSRTESDYNECARLSFKDMKGKVLVDYIVGEQDGIESGVLYGTKIGDATHTYVKPNIAGLADYVLLNVKEGTSHSKTEFIKVGGDRVLTVTSNTDSATLTYANAVNHYGQGRSGYVAYLFGVHFREATFQYPLPLLELMSLFGARYDALTITQRIEKMRVLQDPDSTQKHHRHVSLIGVLSITGKTWAPCMDRMFEWEDITSTFMTAVMIAMATLPPELYVLMASWKGWGESNSMAEYVKNATKLSTALKALDNQVSLGDLSIDLAPLFEWNVLNHRAVTPGYIDDEILERRDTSVAINITREECRAEMKAIFSDIAKKLDSRTPEGAKSPLYTTWDEFYEDRVTITPAGSAFTLHPEMMLGRKTLKANGIQDITKTQVMAELRNGLKLKEVIETRPWIMAQASWKREWSKVRALFAATTEHWLPAAFALSSIEEYMPDDCPIGKAADAHTVCRKVMSMSQEGVVSCLDGKNFNIFHRYDLMSDTIAVASEVLAHRLSPEQHEALAWLTKAELEQNVLVDKQVVSARLWDIGTREGWIKMFTDGAGNERYYAELKVGMFSGVRYTMLFNTFFNRAYYRVAAKRCGVRSKVLHSGDDVYAVFRSFSDCHIMKKALFEINYILQLAKCFVQGVKEFLRISHKNENTSQYLARSAATCVHGRIESTAPTDFIGYAGAILRRAAELVVRHANRLLVMSLQGLQLAGAMARWAVNPLAWEVLLKTPKALGGIAPQMPESGEWDGFAVERSAETRGDAVQYLATLPGVKQTAAKLVEALQIRKYHRRVSEAVGAAIAPKGVIMNYGVAARWLTRRDIKHLHDVRGKLNHIKQGRDYIISKTAGLFNTLAINDHHWGDIGSLLQGIASSWHGLAISFALDKPNPENDFYTYKHPFKLDNTLNDLQQLRKLHEMWFKCTDGGVRCGFTW